MVLAASILLAFAVLHLSLSRIGGGGVLHFTGQGWSLSGDPSPCEGPIEVCLDFQSFLLLHLGEPGRPRRWLWLERASLPARWHALRCAVYSRAPTARSGAAAATSPTPSASPTLS